MLYSVSGTLSGTPSGFPSFALVREIDGTEFYAQGSSLNFEIASSANISNGVQVAELVGTANVLTFDGREAGTGVRRFHPALLELNSDGTGRIQSSNNIPDGEPELEFGAEYITDLTFTAGNTTVITEKVTPPQFGSGSGSAFSPWGLLAIGLLWFCIMVVRRRQRMTSKAKH